MIALATRCGDVTPLDGHAGEKPTVARIGLAAADDGRGRLPELDPIFAARRRERN